MQWTEILEGLRNVVYQAHAAIEEQLRRVHPQFVPFVGGGEGQPVELVVSVSGQAEYFPAVKEFVAQAPEIPGWRIVALKQPLQPSETWVIDTGNTSVALSSAIVRIVEHPASLPTFELYFDNSVDDDPTGFVRLGRSLLVDFLGEELAGKALGEVVVKQLTDEPPHDSLPFIHVREAVIRRGLPG